VAPSTRETYAWCCSRLQDEIGGARLRTFDVEDLEAALDRMSMGSADSKPLSRAALIKIRSVLGQALDFAMRRGLVARNVARIAELTPTAKRTEPKRALQPDQARMVLAAFDGHRLGAMFTIMLTVGLRPGEAAGLSWDDVDVDLGRIAIRRSVQLVRGSPALVDTLKTARSRRTIDLPAVAADSLRHHRKRQLQERMAADTWVDDRLVFATSRGTVLSPANVRRDLASLTESLGLGTWRPNELRHTAASLLSDAGVALEHVADLLGHTNTRMLEQTYRHSVQPSTRAAVAPMDKILGAARDGS
jgi:integrase